MDGILLLLVLILEDLRWFVPIILVQPPLYLMSEMMVGFMKLHKLSLLKTHLVDWAQILGDKINVIHI
jgi:hypothetical protein